MNKVKPLLSNWWLARNKNGELLLFSEKPFYHENLGWCIEHRHFTILDGRKCRFVKFENSPVKIDLTATQTSE